MSTSVDIEFKDFGYFDSDVTGFDDATGLPIFDRAQNSEFLANMLGALIGNGVYPNPSTNLQVIERDDAVFGVQVLPGKIWIDGRFAWPKEPILLEADPASTTADRIDIIVVERNNPDRKFSVKCITGAPAASPVPPTPERTTDVHQRVLCQYRVRKNATKINQSDILDTRMDNELCGYVTGVIEQIDGETLFAQIEAMIQGAETQYTEWFAQIASEWEEWWNNQQDRDGYLTVTGQNPSLLTGDKTVLGGMNEIFLRAANPNLIDNPYFSVCQEAGTLTEYTFTGHAFSPTATNYPVPDRWMLNRGAQVGSETFNLKWQSRAGANPAICPYHWCLSSDTGFSSIILITQYYRHNGFMDDFTRISGDTVFSFAIWCDTDGQEAMFHVDEYAASGNVYSIPVKLTLNAGVNEFKIPYTVQKNDAAGYAPRVSFAVSADHVVFVGTEWASGHRMAANVRFSPVYFKWERGNVVTPCEMPDFADELNRMQAYKQLFSGVNGNESSIYGNCFNVTADCAHTVLKLDRRMIRIPTVTNNNALVTRRNDHGADIAPTYTINPQHSALIVAASKTGGFTPSTGANIGVGGTLHRHKLRVEVQIGNGL